MIFPAIPTPLRQTLEPVLQRLAGPKNLSAIACRMPDIINTLIVQKLLNTAFSEQIEEGDFEFLNERLLQVEIRDAALYVGLSYHCGRILCTHFKRDNVESDVSLSIETADAIDLIKQQVDPDTLFFQRRLKISGDTNLAHHVKNTIDTLDPEVIPSLVMKLVSQYQSMVLNRG